MFQDCGWSKINNSKNKSFKNKQFDFVSVFFICNIFNEENNKTDLKCREIKIFLLRIKMWRSRWAKVGLKSFNLLLKIFRS